MTFSLYCRVTLYKTKSEFSLGEKIDKSFWDQSQQTYTGTGSKRRIVELLIESTSYKLKSAAICGNFSDARSLVDSVFKKTEELTMMAQIVSDHVNMMRDKVKSSTIKNHEIKLQNLLDFENHMNTRYTSQSFDLSVADQYIIWFQQRSNTTNVTTASRNIIYFRTALLHALRKGQIDSFPLMNYKARHDKPKEVQYLNADDLQKIQGYNFRSKTLSRIRDLFIFQCYTGLSYSDLIQPIEIENTEVGKIIMGKRQKNGQSFVVPVCDEAVFILERYQGELPKYSNAAYNRLLKEIAGVCGIEINLTSHIARKTFATLMDANGWTRESVSKMLGHRSTKTTDLYYIGNSSERILQEMKNRVAIT